ncbi:peptidoglycan DD-metalloendopeptidase family protein [Hymenobacter setariae]|uniref:Peptidoglycan DD-metalloendopeptidase family protein n=1 Tax=Hymenobacter setariae TaxID=2594794 RepID=A0A558BMS6_9BACT|nr:peptidoglycan DD-metalloendopeptidase family protein [Hymenobacter setariae]TVT37814.1 peptidoglycan DD-metalloendopeptidase family protein [Hymenobacter setariae]
MPQDLASLLARYRDRLAPIFPFPVRGPGVARLNFTASNPLLAHPEQLRDTAAFAEIVQQMLAEQHATIGIGGYLENRVIYRRSSHFEDATEARSLHLGVDMWVPAGTPVAAPLAGVVHSVADNNNFGDYGPTVIIQHWLEDVPFYTLYGHLSRIDLAALQPRNPVLPGKAFARVGPYPENGDWPPHLHFQVIGDMQGRWGDFPGVAPASEQEYWAKLCPSPWLLLK